MAEEPIAEASGGFHLVVNRKGLGERNVLEGRFPGPDT